jgi:hypothetical protein
MKRMVDVVGLSLNEDQAIAAVGVLVGILALAAGTWAAVFATRADAATRKAMRDAEERHDQEVRPRLEPVGVPPGPLAPHDFGMQVANRGGATAMFAFVVQSDDQIFITSGSLDEHTREPFNFKWVGQLTYKTGAFSTPFVVAQDRHGRWWDCTLQHFLAGRLIEGSLRTWIDRRLAERGLKDLLDGELSWRLLDYRSEDLIKELHQGTSTRRPSPLAWANSFLVRAIRRKR